MEDELKIIFNQISDIMDDVKSKQDKTDDKLDKVLDKIDGYSKKTVEHEVRITKAEKDIDEAFIKVNGISGKLLKTSIMIIGLVSTCFAIALIFLK